jgi:hypothetical protein
MYIWQTINIFLLLDLQCIYNEMQGLEEFEATKINEGAMERSPMQQGGMPLA